MLTEQNKGGEGKPGFFDDDILDSTTINSQFITYSALI